MIAAWKIDEIKPKYRFPRYQINTLLITDNFLLTLDGS